MTQGLDPAFLREGNRVLHDRPFVWLYGLTVPDGDGPGKEIRLAKSNVEVFFRTDSSGAPLSWKPAELSSSGFEWDSEGNLPEYTLTIGDPRRTIGQKIEDWKYLTKPPAPARVLIVNENLLDNPDHALEVRFRVSQTTVTREAATLRLSTYNLNLIQFPQDRIVRQDCRHVYGDDRCGFLVQDWDPGKAQLGQCAQTLAACKERGVFEAANGFPEIHPARFGGFRGVPRTTS
jgi:phage-related protein